ncbi:MAG TPA: class I SAM-dependent methyltransferase [Gemmatimonadaceae bacterium]|nr:class I SAM-dependent methyltransferase [Gemmatimonadaceae bacterium]
MNGSRVASLFSDAPLSTRAFIWLRWNSTPYPRIASVLPARGRMLDLGSGHGLLALALSLGSGERAIIGVDHDAGRVRLAASAMANSGIVSKPRFEVGDLERTLATFPDASLTGIAMIDILHYFDAAAQTTLLREAARVLKPAGILAMREVDSAAGVSAVWNRFYENLSLKVGFTRSLRRQPEFRSASSWTRVLESTGFTVRSELCGSPIFADVLFIGTRAQ